MTSLVVPFLIALGFSLLFGKKIVAALAAAKARQPISDDAPEAHRLKHGTPTMGGLLILGAAITAIVLRSAQFLLAVWASLPATDMSQWLRYLSPLFAVTAVFALACGIGLADDIGKARKKLNKAGLSEKAKLTLQLLVSGLFVGFLALTAKPGITTVITLGPWSFDLGLWYYALAVLYLCFFGNAVNFTDGCDGLASGTTLIASTALAVSAISGSDPNATILTPFYAAIAGACAGFLWFNAHPAKVFMGDTGSLALGMGLAAAALAAKQELLLLLVGLVFVAEIFSMMLQRYVFKYRRIRFGMDYAKANRVFRRAPLHHHFEEMGWPETRVVTRFYIAALVCAALGIAIAPYLRLGEGGL